MAIPKYLDMTKNSLLKIRNMLKIVTAYLRRPFSKRKFREKILPPNHPLLATCYNNITTASSRENNTPKHCYVLNVLQSSLSANHPSINIELVKRFCRITIDILHFFCF
jgi:hypothetical protein